MLHKQHGNIFYYIMYVFKGKLFLKRRIFKQLLLRHVANFVFQIQHERRANMFTVSIRRKCVTKKLV